MRIPAHFLVFLLSLFALQLIAQAENDECATALPLTLYSNEEAAVFISSDTREATVSSPGSPLCADTTELYDLWYSLTLPDTIPTNGFDFKAQFGGNPDDLSFIGMALYKECGDSTSLTHCHIASDPDQAGMYIPNACLEASATYFLRIWSIPTDPDAAGTFEIAAFQRILDYRVLWRETFANGLEENGWLSIGTCGVIDSSLNATWTYLPDGRLNRGSFTPNGIMGTPSICDGAVGVDADFLDNNGDALNPDGSQNKEAFGTGPCPSFFPGNTAQYLLISPVIDISDWEVSALSLEFYQSIRSNGPSSYFISFRTREEEGEWSGWTNIEINKDLEDDGPFMRSDYQQLFLGGATAGDYLQLRFIYNAYYYVWGLDDIALIEAETHNLRIVESRFAIPPNYSTPVGQHLPWYPGMDIYNAGSYFETNIEGVIDIHSEVGNLLHTDTLFLEGLLSIGTAENALFPQTVTNLPMSTGSFTGRYFVVADSTNADNDFDFSDNTAEFAFEQTSTTFAKEADYNRSISIASSIYDPGAPLSYTFGNYFFVRDIEGTYKLDLEWGVANASELQGSRVDLQLYTWTDLNENEIVEASERKLIAQGDYTFTGNEDNITTLSTQLFEVGSGNEGVNLDIQDQAILAMASFTPEDNTTQLFLLGTQELNYGPTVEGYRIKYPESGLGRHYSTVLGFHPSGNLEGIDYEVREFDPNDERIFFGHNIIPLVRLTYEEVSTLKDPGRLSENLSVFPSPASDQIYLEIEEEISSEYQLSIHGMEGNKVFERKSITLQNGKSESLSISHLPAGNYVISLHSDEGRFSGKFVVVRND